MKRIISGLTYDTEKAALIARIWNGLGASDFRNYSKELYRTNRNNFFFYESGGALTSMAVCEGNMTSGSSDIQAVSREDAKKWYLENQNEIGLEISEKAFNHFLGIEEIPA